MPKKFPLDSINVAAPCSENWNEMRGGDTVRFCSHCAKNVHNLSAMTRKKAQKLIAASNGNLCVRYVKQPNGQIQTAERRLHQIGGRVSRIAAGVFGATIALSNAAYAQQNEVVLGDVALPHPIAERQINLPPDKTEPQTSAVGRIYGAVTDPNGAVIPSAKLTLTNIETKETRNAESDGEGAYQFINLLPATYQLQVNALGFAEKQIARIELTSEKQELKVDSLLDVGDAVMVGVIAWSGYEISLIKAVDDNDVKEIKSLISAGANVNQKDEYNSNTTALHVAAENGKLEIVQLLLDFGADVNAVNSNKRTPLMQIDEDANAQLVQKLIDYGAKVDAADDEGNTALMNAAIIGKSKIIKILLAHVSALDAQNKNGETALMKAAKAIKVKTVRALLEAGANPNLRDKDGDSAWQYTENPDIEQLLLSFGATLDEAEAVEHQTAKN